MPGAKPPNLAQLIADAQNRRAQPTGSSGPVGIAWLVEVPFPDHPDWYQDPGRFTPLLDRVTRLPWFSAFDSMGIDHGLGRPLEGRGAIEDALTQGEPITLTLVRGGSHAAQWINEADVSFSIT